MFWGKQEILSPFFSSNKHECASYSLGIRLNSNMINFTLHNNKLLFHSGKQTVEARLPSTVTAFIEDPALHLCCTAILLLLHPQHEL